MRPKKKGKNMNQDFRPYLWVIAEQEPGRPISAVAIFGLDHFRYVFLPERITVLPEERQIEVIGEVAREHYRSNNGRIPCFGRISGYVYYPSCDIGWTLTPEGEVVNRNAGPVKRANYAFSTQARPKRDVSFLFRLEST